ncbi:MAG: sulfatase-like hydrolase/transferase [Thermomicrobiales bacterium]
MTSVNAGDTTRDDPEATAAVLDRRALMMQAVAAGSAAATGVLLGEEEAEAGKRRGKRKRKRKQRRAEKPNVVLFISDQERAIQHFPDGWMEQHLPAQTALAARGVTFNRAFCSTCQCSPSRASLLTGLFPAQHGVFEVLTFDYDPGSAGQAVLPLPSDLPSLASLMSANGYDVVFKGKWHLSKPASWEQPGDSVDWQPSDVAEYGFDAWSPPDAGDQAGPEHLGAGTANNDGRFIDGTDGQEGVIDFIARRKGVRKPFFLIVSLVNPHDSTEYPGIGTQFADDGFDDTLLVSTGIELPATRHEDLAAAGKPSAQQALPAQLDYYLGAFASEEDRVKYLNFYGNLMKLIDGYIGETRAALRNAGHLNNTLFVRTSDHGEMGMAHGGLRQKLLQAYEETIRVPMVYSWPKKLGKGRASDELVSHVDVAPTIASLIGIAPGQQLDWAGRDYSRVVRHPDRSGPNPYVLFTYDEYYAGVPVPPYVGASHIVAYRDHACKIVRYHDTRENPDPDEWEFYDLQADPNEGINIAFTNPSDSRFIDYQSRLQSAIAERLQPQ